MSEGIEAERRTEQIWLLYPAVKKKEKKRGGKNFKDSCCHGNSMVPALKPHPTHPAPPSSNTHTHTYTQRNVINVFIKIDVSRGGVGADSHPNHSSFCSIPHFSSVDAAAVRPRSH